MIAKEVITRTDVIYNAIGTGLASHAGTESSGWQLAGSPCAVNQFLYHSVIRQERAVNGQGNANAFTANRHRQYATGRGDGPATGILPETAD